MIDTIKLSIKGVRPYFVSRIRSKLLDSIKVDNQTGEQLSCFTSGSLLGSWDSRISIRIKDREFISGSAKDLHYIHDANTEAEKLKRKLHVLIIDKIQQAPIEIPCDEYLEIEFSLAKWAYGVNFFNVPLIDDLRNIIKFRYWLQSVFDIELPDLYNWQVDRVDIAVNYDFENLQSIREYILLWRGLDYPRRKKPTFYSDSLYIPGSSTTIKAYAKRPEFQIHDLKRVKNFLIKKFGEQTLEKNLLVKERIDKLVNDIDGIFRFEVEFHKRKLKSLDANTVKKVFEINWEIEMQKEIAKLIGDAPSGKIYTLPEVTQKIGLAADNGYLQGKKVSKTSMIAIYTALVTHGEKYAKSVFNPRQVQRVKKVLAQLNISLLSTLTDNEKIGIHNKCDIKNFKVMTPYYKMRDLRKLTNLKTYKKAA